MKLLTVLIAAALLSGCATSADLRSSRHPAATAQVSAPVRSVYKSARDFVRECRMSNMITAQVVMESDFNDEANTGTVEQVFRGAFGPDTYMAIDVSQTTPRETHVEVNAKPTPFGQTSESAKDDFLKFIATHKC